jgi:hypothetical protein
MRIAKKAMAVLAAVAVMGVVLVGCATKVKTNTVILDDKGKGFDPNIPTPEWVTVYQTKNISGLQNLDEYKDFYCFVGTESGINKQFVLAWADNFSAQQQIGAMIRTTIASAFQAKREGMASSQGGSGAQSTLAGSLNQSIDDAINSVVAAQYTGAQRENDWWRLTRTYDPDDKTKFQDEYTAWVFYTFPRDMLKNQLNNALNNTKALDPEAAKMAMEIGQDILSGKIALNNN